MKKEEEKVKSECKNHNKNLGERGERAAELFLKKHDYVILEKNWRCKYGEADLVAMDGDCLVFVEVKTRSSREQGFPSEAVGQKKRAKYEQIALEYLAQSDLCDLPMRFDVVDIVRVDDNRAALRHHVNAFGVA